jgi:hypothetical protein
MAFTYPEKVYSKSIPNGSGGSGLDFGFVSKLVCTFRMINDKLTLKIQYSEE